MKSVDHAKEHAALAADVEKVVKLVVDVVSQGRDRLLGWLH